MAPASTGTCALCGQRLGANRIASHIAECAPSHDASGVRQTLVQVRVASVENPLYWLLVEARGDATLQHLDALLRRVWLECCGHMSAFLVERREAAMRSKVGDTLGRTGVAFAYDYDFGSTTSLRGKVVAVREGRLGRAATRLLARNDPPLWHCEACKRPATLVCPFCMGERPYLFCAEHAKRHPCAEEEAYLPVVNSPRMGVCAYTG